ncbi:MAG: DUF4435 domain-containing protein [Culturomica sp.]|jgi:hypothetical protein|nr:DUF4435 domain-containing protein [Culturomica sp.]
MHNPQVDKETRDSHFAALAKRYALDAKMLKCRAAVHVENKNDIAFWGTVLKHFYPNLRFHFISASRNEYGHETSGVTQALKYYNYLNPDFFICIDSDYRYLMREKGINPGKFVIQTYTYSFENHLCYAEGLNEICERTIKHPNTIFSFSKFLREYSNILYDLFIWHLYFLHNNPMMFTKLDFNRYINLLFRKRNFSIYDNGKAALEEFRIRISKRIAYFNRKYPNANLDYVRKKYARLGLIPSQTYLFVRGHNVYDMVSLICREVCRHILKKEENQLTRSEITSLYNSHRSIDIQLLKNLHFGEYFAIRKIEYDLAEILNK